ncbi:MAG: hypothetical protein DRG83_08380 [Deltaproteobacteria bacterium]|nr:MAG: hypothetical protein DRG83_08380 [Deltaproteobacteria bacterium]
MKENRHYIDLLKAHKIFTEIEGRWKFYDTYMKSKDPEAWFKSGDVPLKEGLLLFGFIHSWDPNFQGDLAKFLEIYKDIFPLLKDFKNTTLIEVDLSDEIKNCISVIFDRIAMCPRTKRYESTDASKILHAIIPDLFVMWDGKIRKAVIGDEECNGRCYAFEFLPKMQELAREYLDSFIKEKGGDYKSAAFQISRMADNYSLSKLIDEYNYVRYTKRKSLTDIRNISL